MKNIGNYKFLEVSFGFCFGHSLKDFLLVTQLDVKRLRNQTVRRTSCFLEVPKPLEPEMDPDPGADQPSAEFRSRSKSLDCGDNRRIQTDCETAYRIFDDIIHEGK